MKNRTDDRLVDDVARKMAEVREDRGLTQQDLAERLGISTQYVRKLESGTVNVSLRSMNHMVRARRVSVVSLFEEPKSRAKRKPGRPRLRTPS